MTEDLQNLEDRRDRLYQKLPSFGDFRLGIISETYTRCGKKNCACAHKDHPGHGPRYLWNTTRQGKSLAQHLRLGPELDHVYKQIETGHRFHLSACLHRQESGVRRRWNSMKGSAA